MELQTEPMALIRPQHPTRFEIDEKLIKNEYPEYFVN